MMRPDGGHLGRLMEFGEALLTRPPVPPGRRFRQRPAPPAWPRASCGPAGTPGAGSTQQCAKEVPTASWSRPCDRKRSNDGWPTTPEPLGCGMASMPYEGSRRALAGEVSTCSGDRKCGEPGVGGLTAADVDGGARAATYCSGLPAAPEFADDLRNVATRLRLRHSGTGLSGPPHPRV